MAQDREIAEILSEARDKNMLFPCNEKDRLLADYVNTARRILHVIDLAGTEGIFLIELTQTLRLNKNTVATYTRELTRQGLIYSRREGRETLYRIRAHGE